MRNLNKGKEKVFIGEESEGNLWNFSDVNVTVNGKEFSITRKMFSFRSAEKTVHGKLSEINSPLIMFDCHSS